MMPGTSRLPVSLRSPMRLDRNRRLSVQTLLGILRNLLLILFVLRWTRKAVLQIRGRGILGSSFDLYGFLRRAVYDLFLRLPGVRAQVDSQVAEAINKIQSKLVPSGPGTEGYTSIPKEGWTDETVRLKLQELVGMSHPRWEDGRVSGAVYHGGKALSDLQTQAYGMFAVTNPIHPDVFPGVRKMEAEIVAMVLKMFHAPEDGAGATTSGGTESILMACLSARRKAERERGVAAPEMILPETAHAAFRKACDYFKIKYHLVSCPKPSYQVDTRAVARLINGNTILLVGSAPNFPHGIIDDIVALAALARRRKIPLHVDCCLGSFLMPYLGKAGFKTRPFDFRVEGVTSISCDTHKYGFAPKGSSTILYRTAALRAYQYFISADWPGGVYGSPTSAGSRPGSLIAGCWASMMRFGESGYVEACHKIVSTTNNIIDAIKCDPGLKDNLLIMGEPLVSVVAFTSLTVDIYDIADAMTAKGWHLNVLQTPPAMHVAVTLPMVESWRLLIADLAAVIESEKEKERVRLAEGRAPTRDKGDCAALYGVAGSLPSKAIVVQLAQGYLDTMFKA